MEAKGLYSRTKKGSRCTLPNKELVVTQDFDVFSTAQHAQQRRDFYILVKHHLKRHLPRQQACAVCCNDYFPASITLGLVDIQVMTALCLGVRAIYTTPLVASQRRCSTLIILTTSDPREALVQR